MRRWGPPSKGAPIKGGPLLITLKALLTQGVLPEEGPPPKGKGMETF